MNFCGLEDRVYILVSGKYFSLYYHILISSGAHQADSSWGSFPQEQSHRVSTILTAHLNLVLRLRIHGALSPLSLYVFMARHLGRGRTLPLFLRECRKLLNQVSYFVLLS